MTEPTGGYGGGKPGNIWSRRSTLGKGLIIALGVIVAIAVIGAVTSSGDNEAASPPAVSPPAAEPEPSPAEPAPAEPAPAEEISGRVDGRFARDCLFCGDLKQFIKVSDAWCGWRGDTLLVHVRMTNESIEHVTVHWHPSYTFVGGGEHGAGLSSIQDDGFDPGETRELIAEQHPEGVPPGSQIGECKPSFSLIESG